jgi:hypothetical protein
LPIVNPLFVSSFASVRVLFTVHLNGDIGSPRITGSINNSNSFLSQALFLIFFYARHRHA